MEKLRNWLGLIRWRNLLIVFVTQFVVWYCLIFDPNNFLGYLPALDFLMLTGSTICIAAAGYIINDYFDIKIDLINRPGKVTLEKSIPLRHAIIGHVIFNIIGLVMAYAVAAKQGNYQWLLLQLACIVLLWFYSTHFKRQYVLGNVVIALLAALTVLVLWVYEPALRMVYKSYVFRQRLPAISPLAFILGYSGFAFLLTWIREIVKDMEDLKGDTDQGCTTMPIVKGLQFALRFAQVLTLIATTAVLWFTVYFFKAHYLMLGIYTIVTMLMPLLAWLWFSGREHTSAHYQLCSKWLKYIMLSGVFSLAVYHFSSLL